MVKKKLRQEIEVIGEWCYHNGIYYSDYQVMETHGWVHVLKHDKMDPEVILDKPDKVQDYILRKNA